MMGYCNKALTSQDGVYGYYLETTHAKRMISKNLVQLIVP